MENFISTDSLKNTLGPDTFKTLSDQAINAGANFLSGQTTNVFNKAMSVSSVKSLTQLTTTSIGAGFVIKEALDPNILKQITTQLINTTITTVSSATAEIAAKAVSKLTQKVATIPQSIASYTMSYFNTYKMSLGEVLKELLAGSETIAAQETEKSENNKLKTFLNETENFLSNMNNKITYYTDKVTPVVEMITTYVANGPDWIADKLNKEVNAVITDINSFANQQTETAEKNIDNFCRKTGEKNGKKMVEAYNKTLDKQAKKTQAKINAAKTKAIGMAKAAQQQAILKIMSLTGINIPVPV